MSGQNPEAILYDVNGNLLAIQSGVAIPASTPLLMFGGSDGTNARYILVDGSGRTVSVGAGVAGTPAGGVISIQGVAGGTILPIAIATPDTTATGALGALNATVPIILAGTTGVAMQLLAGTLVATIVPEVSVDGGTTWVSTFFDDPSTGNKVSSIVFAANNTATTRVLVSADGASNMRVRVSAYTSGTATCNLRGSSQDDPSVLFSGTAGGVLPPTIVQIGGTDGSNLRGMLTDSSGHPIIVGPGTAGTPTGGVVTIQGISGGQVVPVSGTVAVTQSTSPWVDNISQFGGTNISTGTGASGTGIPRVTVSNDSNILATQSGTWTVTATQTTPANLQAEVGGLAAAGAVPVGNPVQIGGSDGTDIRTILTDVSGHPIIVGDGVAGTPAGGVVSIQGVVGGTAVPVSGSVTVSPFADRIVSGTLVNPGDTVAINTQGTPAIVMAITGTWTGTITFQILVDEVNGTWASQVMYLFAVGNISTALSTTTINNNFKGNVSGANQFRVQMSGGNTGTANITIEAGQGTAISSVQQGAGASTANSWSTKITDGSNGPAAVKAASTAAAAADPSLVVGLSPNSPLPAGSNIIGTVNSNNTQLAEVTAAWTSATTINTVLALTITDYATAAITFNQGSTITGGVVTFEVSDTVAGTNWYPITVIPTSDDIVAATAPSQTYTLVAGTNAAFQASTAGFVQIRVRLSTVISGTATVNVGIAATSASIQPVSAIEVQGMETVGNPATFNPLFTAYEDVNGNVRYPTFNVVAGGGFGGPTTYSNVVTDLESYRDDFPGTSLVNSLSGTCVFTNGASTVTGTGFIAELNTTDIYVKFSSDPDSAYTKLAQQPFYAALNGNTILTLVAPYSGTGGSGAGSWTYWAPTTGASGAIAVGSGIAKTSEVALTSGIGAGVYTYIQHATHYVAPCNITAYAKVGTLQQGQEIAIGLVDNITSPNQQTLFVFSGNNPNTVTLRTSQTGVTVESNTSSLPNNISTFSYQRYRIACSTDGVVLFCNDIPIIRNKLHVQSLYQPQPITIAAYNTTNSTQSCIVYVDAVGINSQDLVEVEMVNTVNPAPAQISGFDTSGNYQQATVFANSAIGSLAVSLADITGKVLSLNLNNGNNSVPVFDTNTNNRLDQLYTKLDDIFNLFLGTISVKQVAQPPVRVFTTAQSAFAASTTAITLLNTNTYRAGATIVNDSGGNGSLYLLLGATGSPAVSTTNYTVQLAPGNYFEVPFGFSGRIDGVWTTTTGNAYITDIMNANL